MTPYHADAWLTVYLGDCAAVLAELESESVNCVVTSPPYWGLRDYGTATWEGGDEGCDHSTPRSRGDDIRDGDKQGTSAGSRPNTVRVCRCGAVRQDSQLGLEPTPEAYVAALVAVFREVRRVLRKDGTVWLNLGDSYAGGGGFSPAAPSNLAGAKQTTQGGARSGGIPTGNGLKPKDRVMIPARVALALQADGWWLRDEIVWHKPNPMPSSVTDRTTPAHEMVYLLTKSARYWYDADAVREPHAGEFLSSGVRNPRAAYATGNMPHQDRGEAHEKPAARERGLSPSAFAAPLNPAGRNKRSVWTIATQPYPEAHFATFPEALVEPMILAGCPVGGVVLDPFAGSGTTGAVAQRLSRRAVLIDLSAEYMKQLIVRNRHIPLGLPA